MCEKSFDCLHQIDTDSDRHTPYTRCIWDEDKSIIVLGVLSGASNRVKLNNGLHDALRNKAVHIIVQVLQSATANDMEKAANEALPSAKSRSQKCQMVGHWPRKTEIHEDYILKSV